MPSNELKQRKKGTNQGKQNEDPPETAKDGGDLAKKDARRLTCAAAPALDLRTVTCLVSLSVCLALTWFVLQQTTRFAEVEEKYKLLYRKTADIQGLENEIGKISRQFENTQALMNKVKDHAVLTHIETLEQDIDRLKLWSSSLTEKREMLQENMTALSLAVEKIEQTTTSITKDVSVKVSAVKTDVRRMSGLESDVSALLSSTHKLEEKVKQAEKMMVQKIGDVLASSINRMMELKSSTEKNTEKIDFLKRKVAELKEEDDKLSQRLWTLESGRARLLKTVAFAGDLKPKVFVIRKDFALLEPRVSDLTLRIGRLASDLLQREQEIAVLKDSFTNLTLVKTDLQNVKQKLNEVPEVSDLFAQTKQPAE